MRSFYRNFVMVGVLGLGLAACGDDVTIPVPPPPPPPAETPNITSFSVSPTSATIAPGTFVQASSTLITKAGVTGTVTWASSNPAIATVDATGLITAVAQGAAVVTATATAGGQTATASVGVTVRPIAPAQISIQSVTTGATNVPVNISNVFGQIEINMNFDPGEQIVDSVAVFIGNKRAARQTFATSPSAGPISLSVNTANYVKNTNTGVATVDYQNGPSTISAAVYPRGSTATATNTIQIVLNNADGWAADMSAPSALANSAAGLTYWGGPTAGGLTTVTVYPVIYTAGRSVATVTFRAGGCPTFTDTSLPFRATFGYTTAGATAPNCGGAAGYEWAGGARDNVVVTAAIDNTNNAYPLTPTIANTVVLGSTPDSLRFDWRSPAVTTPSLTRVLPAVTGWVNAAFSFINYASADAGVGLRATRDRAVTYSAPNCGGATGVAMPSGTGADIPECATNSIGGAPAIANGTGPYRVTGTESDRLNNLGTSAATATFGVDKTVPSIRWGLVDAVVPYIPAVSADTTFRAAKPTVEVWRAEYLDAGVAASGFYNAGQPLAGVAAQRHSLARASHVNNAGICVVGTGGPGAAFVTAPACGLVSITAGGSLRTDGWQGGQNVGVPTPEGYHGYTTDVTDAAGNTTSTLFRKALVNTVSPFASLLGAVSGTITASNMAFTPTFADSAEIAGYSLQMEYPAFANLTGGGETDSLRYPRTAVGAIFNDAITSPFSANISPATGAPYVRHAEAVTAAAFPGNNVQAAPAATKPTSVAAWSWNWGGTMTGGPAPGRTALVALPALLVQDGVTFNTFNTGNVTNSVTHFRVISTVSTTNQFGSTTPLRAQAASPTNTPNAPFARVDFYRWDGAAAWNYLGSATGPVQTDQGTYRSWVWSLPNGSFTTTWAGAAQGAVAAGNIIAAVGVTAAGDGLVAGATMVP